MVGGKVAGSVAKMPSVQTNHIRRMILGPLRSCAHHLPSIPVRQPACCSIAAQVVSLVARPLNELHHKTPGPHMPYRIGNRPVIRPALLGVHTGAAEYHCVSFRPS